MAASSTRAHARRRLLEHGSRRTNLLGANYYPGRGSADCIEYTSLISISPRRGNRTMEILDPSLRQRVREITFALVGRGEESAWPSTPT